MREALLYESLSDGRVRCGVCQRRCVIPADGWGYCRTRVNREGQLFSATYGRVACRMISPIEKKPVFHFYPGSRWLSLGSLGCNFRCPGCQNWEIAHADGARPERALDGRMTEYISPERCVELAQRTGCAGLSWTYNEPTLWFEYTLDGARLARDRGLYTNYVTNGTITPEALDEIGPYLDVFRVDVKGFSAATYRRIAHLSNFEGILKAAERAKTKWGMHVEVVTNVIPGINDEERELRDIASWIRRDLGQGTPWHVTQFVPHLDLSDVPPTPVRTLERAREIGLEAGLQYVYLGNVPGHPGEHTYCPHCGILLIERYHMTIIRDELMGNQCPKCGTEVSGRFEGD